jgi:amino-acid N-acetyltransferase
MEEPEIDFVDAHHEDLEQVIAFLKPFIDEELLLPRTSIEMELMLRHGFIAKIGDSIVGFAAIEIYSRKLAEIQCLAVSHQVRRRGVGRRLVANCVNRAREQRVLELMAISSSEEIFQACGFDYSLPNQKRAFFVQPLEDLTPDPPPPTPHEKS